MKLLNGLIILLKRHYLLPKPTETDFQILGVFSRTFDKITELNKDNLSRL